jgi:membrane protease YdiL (CAAX protease family)
MNHYRRPFPSASVLVGAGTLWILFIAMVNTYVISFMRDFVTSRSLSDLLLWWYGEVAVKGIGWFAVLMGVFNHFCPENGLNWRLPVRGILVSVLHTAIVSTIVWAIWTGLPTLIGLRPPPESIWPTGSVLTWIGAAAFYVPVSACLQELFCRGLLLQLLLEAGMSPLYANVFQSIAFALGHAPEMGLHRFLDLTLFGLVMGWSRFRYRSLIPAFVVHTGGNIFAWFLGWM